MSPMARLNAAPPSLLQRCALALAAALASVAIASAAPAAPARVGAVACPGVVKVAYGTFSHIVVTGLTCSFARTFVKTTGGVPHGWACTGRKTSPTTTVDSCKHGPKSLSYHFKTA